MRERQKELRASALKYSCTWIEKSLTLSTGVHDRQCGGLEATVFTKKSDEILVLRTVRLTLKSKIKSFVIAR